MLSFKHTHTHTHKVLKQKKDRENVQHSDKVATGDSFGFHAKSLEWNRRRTDYSRNVLREPEGGSANPRISSLKQGCYPAAPDINEPTKHLISRIEWRMRVPVLLACFRARYLCSCYVWRGKRTRWSIKSLPASPLSPVFLENFRLLDPQEMQLLHSQIESHSGSQCIPLIGNSWLLFITAWFKEG